MSETEAYDRGYEDGYHQGHREGEGAVWIVGILFAIGGGVLAFAACMVLS